MKFQYFIGLLIGLCMAIISITILTALKTPVPSSIDNLVLVLGGAVATSAVPGIGAAARKVGAVMKMDDEPDTIIQTGPVITQPAVPAAPSSAQTPLGQASFEQQLEQMLALIKAGKETPK